MSDPSVKLYRRGLRQSDLADSWSNILWREQHHCHDKQYRAWLYEAIVEVEHTVLYKKQGRPHAFEVEIALRQGCRNRSDIKNICGPWLNHLYREKQKPTSADDLIACLQHSDSLERFIAGHVLAYRGGEVIQPLQTFARKRLGRMRSLALWVLASISAETEIRLAAEQNNVRCTRCLTTCQSSWIDLPWRQDITFYGCRTCRQSRHFYHSRRDTVVVLDDTWSVPYRQQSDNFYVNWALHASPFDFDRIEILRATDEVVERFAVRVGNDTDVVRKARYAHLPCNIGPDCHLSANTVRILESIFGQVQRVDL